MEGRGGAMPFSCVHSVEEGRGRDAPPRMCAHHRERERKVEPVAHSSVESSSVRERCARM
jgi:hypothetical protein